jgi:hypothetical protein
VSYPEPHYDEEDTCQCPDHVAMRIERMRELADKTPVSRIIRQAIGDSEDQS